MESARGLHRGTGRINFKQKLKFATIFEYSTQRFQKVFIGSPVVIGV